MSNSKPTVSYSIHTVSYSIPTVSFRDLRSDFEVLARLAAHMREAVASFCRSERRQDMLINALRGQISDDNIYNHKYNTCLLASILDGGGTGFLPKKSCISMY